ncbi:Armadillo-type fold [Ostreococcus tauri]|uniref:Armadillo-type fold n=1 Tax=Ostreococcus tauri TaxID=70448 RepID=A0A096P8E5_OSTTA|nr:Armadillo-type fold [Ostreococcus tauri]CEG00268.1 Armadillo-type fold [Ostreococcus tauri]|eukprot:XP_003083485.2 Armadillo-type fold [Ostreococcus tauri]
MSPSEEDELLNTVLFLINGNYLCALYELYVDARRTNALEKSVAAENTLKSFFADKTRFPPEVFKAVSDAFDSGVSASRVIEAESRAAVAEYELRLLREDLDAQRRDGTDGGGDGSGSNGQGRSTVKAMEDDDAFSNRPDTAVGMDRASTGSRASGSDIDARLDAATYEYLSRRGYKATALSMRDESRTAATLNEKDFMSDKETWGEFGALRRMYERARMTEQTASALEQANSHSEDVENELIRARARLEELEHTSTSAIESEATMSAALTRAQDELSALRGSSTVWEKRAVHAESEVSRLLSELRTEKGDWSSTENGAPRTTIEENETLDACVSFIGKIAPKIAPAARIELLPMISRACERAAGDKGRASRAARLFFDLYASPSDSQRDAIAIAIAGVGERVGMKAFEAIFTQSCLDVKEMATLSGEARVLALDVVVKIGTSSWFTSTSLVTDWFRFAAVDPNDEMRTACARAAERFVLATSPDETSMETIDTLFIALVRDESDDVSEVARLTLAPAVARCYLRSNPQHFMQLARKVLEQARDALRSGWTGEGHDRVFSGWLSPEDGDRHRWCATSMMKTFESFCPSISDALGASKPSSVEDDVSVALSKDIPDSWTLAKWCVNDASDMITEVISSTARDVVGQESVRECICTAVAAWCGVLGPAATRRTFLGKLNDACGVSHDQRSAVLPILLAGVVPYTPSGDTVLGDYLKRLIRQTESAAADEIIDATRLLAAFERHTSSLIGALKECSYPIADNTPNVRVITARLVAATSEILHLEQVLADVYPMLNALRSDPDEGVRAEAALALAAVACAHYETFEPTMQTMRQLEALVSDPSANVRVACVQALARGAEVPGTSFSASAAGAISAISNLPAVEPALALALFDAARLMLGTDGDLFPHLAPALESLLNAEALDQARRAQAETMLRDGGWSAASTSIASSNANVANVRAQKPTGVVSGTFGRLKSRLSRNPSAAR